MKLLLDTHASIWFVEQDPALPDQMRRLIESDGTQVYVSAASIWEIAIKVGKGKLKLLLSLDEIVSNMRLYGFLELPIAANDLLYVYSLPQHHHDPFDRALVAQAKAHGLLLVSRDPLLRRYDVDCMWD